MMTLHYLYVDCFVYAVRRCTFATALERWLAPWWLRASYSTRTALPSSETLPNMEKRTMLAPPPLTAPPNILTSTTPSASWPLYRLAHSLVSSFDHAWYRSSTPTIIILIRYFYTFICAERLQIVFRFNSWKILFRFRLDSVSHSHDIWPSACMAPGCWYPYTLRRIYIVFYKLQRVFYKLLYKLFYKLQRCSILWMP